MRPAMLVDNDASLFTSGSAHGGNDDVGAEGSHPMKEET
jgi:hypothetical protein